MKRWGRGKKEEMKEGGKEREGEEERERERKEEEENEREKARKIYLNGNL